MRVFKTRWFACFARSEGLRDDALAAAVRQAEAGLIAANLGGGLIKLRVARQGGGKSGGYRTLLAYRKGERAVFLFGFAKSERDNISDEQLANLKEVAADILARNEALLTDDIEDGRLHEVDYDEEE